MANDPIIRLLLVDDEPDFLKTTALMLRRRGIDVTACESGAEALDALEARPYHVAILDLKMPGMGGEELLAEIRTRHPEVEIVILTGHGDIHAAVRCIKEGAYAFLQKPCGPDAILRSIREAFEIGNKTRHRIRIAWIERMLKGPVTPDGKAALDELARMRSAD